MTMARKRKKDTKVNNATLPVMRPDAAGIDIGATEIFVAVPADRATENVRSFPTFTQDLYALADWLKQCGIRTVAMESTGVYWIPLFQILEERQFEVCSLLRHRESLVQMAATHVHHNQKALDQMNLQVHHVISDIVGRMGLAIV